MKRSTFELVLIAFYTSFSQNTKPSLNKIMHYIKKLFSVLELFIPLFVFHSMSTMLFIILIYLLHKKNS